MIALRWPALLLCALGCASGFAQNLGVQGRVYGIAERDAIAQMQDAVKAKLANGGREAMMEGAKARYVASLEHIPTPEGIVNATTSAKRLVDLTETIPDDIRAPDGVLIVAAGTKVNPLALRPLSKKVFFLDASVLAQVHWVGERAAVNDTIILLGGSVFEAGKALGRKVYLDIPGLHGRMKIRALPSMVYQQGEMLAIEEVAL